jgi:type II secretion system protein G
MFSNKIINSRVSRGFTLIELLVVIAIIGMLSSVVLAALSGAQREARDKRRVADLKNIQKAIELYVNDNGSYPKEADGENGDMAQNTTFIHSIGPYLKSKAFDPAGAGNATYHYYYDGAAQCGGRTVAIIFARQMDNASNSNYLTTLNTSCGGVLDGEGRGSGAESYNIILGSSGG